ncbi:MAG: hypothetical protein Q9227_004520 [Pyrenula ochraceoflavens]
MELHRLMSIFHATGVGSSNNYAYVVSDEATKEAVVIDPANPPECVRSEEDYGHGQLVLTCTLKSFPSTPIIGGKDCAHVTKTPAHSETFSLGKSISITPLHTPCHTQDSICYYMQDDSGSDIKRAVFTGDTLFIGGCGKFFEGDASQMHTALNKTLAALPDDTAVYPGHEYTKNNAKFLVKVDGGNQSIRNLEKFAAENRETQGKFTIGDEKKHNVFMRVTDDLMQKATGETDPVGVMGMLREMKNNM